MYGSEKQEKLMNPLWWQVPFGALLLALIFTCNKTVLDLSEQSHCPFCYGNDFCPALKDASLQYNTLQKITFNVLSVKNVFFAHLGERELVLKKLADYGDFFKFNQDVIQSESLLKLLSDQSRNFHTCSGASAKRLLERLPARNLANLWTIVNVNVEPLLLELFRKEDKWPVPQLFGYCGRLVVEENCGVPLNAVQTFEWHHRAHIALQLLQAAEKFTMGHADFRLYMTDISPDNIAVNLRNFTVAFVDLEHGILQEILPDGVVLIDDEYKERKVFGQVVCSFRYGREEDEVMGLNFQKDLFLASAQIYPPAEKQEASKLQDRLVRKLGENCFPFRFTLPPSAPASVTLQPGQNDDGQPCGVHYYVKLFVGENETDRTHKRSTVSMAIRKVQYAPSKQGRQPCTIVRKDFMLSPGELELEVTLDKQVYHHGEKIAVNICVRNNSNKVVKKLKAMVQQGVDVVLFQNGQYRTTVANIETQEGCPINPGSSLQKVIYLLPLLTTNKDRRGIALDGQLKKQDTNLASTTLLATPDQRDAFGIIVSYAVKVKLYLGALGGELAAELPFVLMHPKPNARPKLMQADSQADVEMFRQDTVEPDIDGEQYD